MIQFLKTIPLFSNMETEEIKQILHCSKSKVLSFQKNSPIFEEGEVPEHIFILQKGKILVSKHLSSGKRNVICEIHQKEVFGILIDPMGVETYWYDAIAVMDCEVLCIPWKFLFHMCPKVCGVHQKFMQNMFRVQSEINVYQMKKLNILSGVTIEAKIALLMLQLMDEHGKLDFKMNREELADYLGITRPSLSRTLMQMRKKEWISIRKSKVEILNLNELERICSR